MLKCQVNHVCPATGMRAATNTYKIIIYTLGTFFFCNRADLVILSTANIDGGSMIERERDTEM